MCGITGFFSYANKIDTKKYYEAHLKIVHRGPDDEGFIYKNKNNNEIEHLRGNDTIKEYQNKEHILKKPPSSLILGHRRLSIIDLTFHGHQPYSFNNLYLVYNGEIYNYIELKKELKKAGYKFETDTDTEVFLKAFHYWGIEAFNKFNGMWAAAIYDKQKDELILTRDRFGIKPLYYSLVDNNLIFGSEIKFVASFFNSLYCNEQMVYDYLRFNYINHTNETLFKDIFQLEPGHYLKFSKNNIKISRYWDIKIYKKIFIKDLEETLNDSIRLRLRSDVEVGSLLSGGIDSSLILGIINDQKYVSNFQTFSAVFKEEQFSEKKYIDKFDTENLKLKKHFIYPDSQNLKNIIDELIYTQEEPLRSLSVFSQYSIYKYIKKNTNVKVLLNGQGADELFSGYTEHYYIFLLELLRTFKFKKFFSEFNFFKNNRNLSTLNVIKHLLMIIVRNNFVKLDKYRIFNKKFQIPKNTKKFDNLLKNYLWNNLSFSALREYLRYEDKNSMKFSLESRLPFLDFRIVQMAFSLQDKYLIDKGLTKIILRQIAKDKVPKEILNRKDKMGFVSPQEIWQRTILKEELDKAFDDIRVNGLFNFINVDRVNFIYDMYKNNKMQDWSFIWRLYCLYKWKKVWKIKS